MKILFVQDTDWIKRNPGQQHHYAERLVLRGHEVRVIDYDVLWPENGKKLLSKRKVFKNVSKIFDDANITVIRPRIIKIPILDYVSMLVTYRREVEKQIKEFSPDIIVGQALISNYFAVRASKKYGIPIIFQMNDVNATLIPFKFLQPIGKIIESHNLKKSDETVVINEVLREYAVKSGSDPNRTHVIPAGVDLKRYDPTISGDKVRDSLGLDSNDFILFFMGWLYHFAGLKEVLIELGKKRELYPHLKILIVGDGDAFEDLKSIIKQYALEQVVILTGKQPFERIPEFISVGDVCILPSYLNDIMRNIVPIKIYEYMAMEKPVITTKLPGVMKEFGKDNGVIYVDKPEDVISKSFKLDICSNGKNARNFVENNDWDKITDKFEDKLLSLTNNNHFGGHK